jgi:hypothetical protein
MALTVKLRLHAMMSCCKKKKIINLGLIAPQKASPEYGLQKWQICINLQTVEITLPNYI